MKSLKAFSYLMAANMEAAALVIAAWWLGTWLDENYPISVSWLMICFVVAGMVIVHSWYLIFRTILRLEKADEKRNKKTK